MTIYEIRIAALDAAIRMGFTATDEKLATDSAIYRVTEVADWLTNWIRNGDPGNLPESRWTGKNDEE